MAKLKAGIVRQKKTAKSPIELAPRPENEHGLKNYQRPDSFGAWLGYQIIKIDRKNSNARTSLKLRGDHLSPAGRVHGGVISSFLDFSCGAAVFSTMDPHDFCSTVELKVNYFRPLDEGDELHCNADVMFRGKRLCVVQAMVYRKGEKAPVAMATATFNVVCGARSEKGAVPSQVSFGR